MFRSFIPFLLASLGFTMISSAVQLPLFEWQLSEIVTDFSSPCSYAYLPPYWTARFGQSLVTEEGKFHYSENPNVVLRRSQNDEMLERVSLNLYDKIPWLFDWSWIGIVLSIIYIWWFILWHKQGTASQAVILTMIAVGMCILSLPIMRILAGPVIPIYIGTLDCHGTVTFSARLSKIHYEMPVVLFTGVLVELGALGMMAHQIVRTVIQRKDSSKLAVG